MSDESDGERIVRLKAYANGWSIAQKREGINHFDCADILWLLARLEGAEKRAAPAWLRIFGDTYRRDGVALEEKVSIGRWRLPFPDEPISISNLPVFRADFQITTTDILQFAKEKAPAVAEAGGTDEV